MSNFIRGIVGAPVINEVRPRQAGRDENTWLSKLVLGAVFVGTVSRQGRTGPPSGRDFVVSLPSLQVWLHLVFSTRNREALLQNPAFREEMFRMLCHQVQECGCIPKFAGGGVDHVHLVCGLSRGVPIARLVEHVKTETSKWAQKSAYGVAGFAWQSGYGVFSVSQSRLEQVIDYVAGQENHHKWQSYQEEFRELCEKHAIEIDERTAWD